MAIGQNTQTNRRPQAGESLEAYAMRTLFEDARASGFTPDADVYASPAPYDTAAPAIQRYAHFVTQDSFVQVHLRSMLGNNDPSVMDRLIETVGKGWSIRSTLPDDAAGASYAEFASDLMDAIVNQDEAAVIGLVAAPPAAIVSAPAAETEPAIPESGTGFLDFLERLNAGIATEDGFDYNRDLLTYVQSDQHYVAAIESALGETSLPQDEKDTILESARTAFAESELVVMDPDYEFDVSKLSLASQIVAAGFNGDVEELDRLAETIVENGGQMPALETITDADLFAAPTAPEDAPAEDYEIPRGEHNPDALQVTITDPILTDPDAATDIADANILLNGVAADDMGFLEDLVDEARELGVDTELLTSISAEISSNDFVTSQAAAEGVRAYAETLKAALENDDLITNDEYKGALTNLFTGIAGGMVVDRVGLADDIAAAPGMEDQATRLMREALQARPQTLGLV